MVKILVLMIYLMNTGDVFHDAVELKVADMTRCRTYVKQLAQSDLPPNVRDAHYQCIEVKIDPLRGSRRA